MLAYFCLCLLIFSASADLITMNALYTLFFFVQARFKPLVNQFYFVFSKLFCGTFYTGQFLLNISIICVEKSHMLDLHHVFSTLS